MKGNDSASGPVELILRFCSSIWFGMLCPYGRFPLDALGSVVGAETGVCSWPPASLSVPPYPLVNTVSWEFDHMSGKKPSGCAPVWDVSEGEGSRDTRPEYFAGCAQRSSTRDAQPPAAWEPLSLASMAPQREEALPSSGKQERATRER